PFASQLFASRAGHALRQVVGPRQDSDHRGAGPRGGRRSAPRRHLAVDRDLLCNNGTLAIRQACRSRRPQMRKTFVAITAFALVPLGAAGCVSKSEYTKAMQSAEVRYNALEAQNTRLTSDLADAGKRNEQLTAERAQLERTLTMKSGELGQRVSTLEGDNARLKQELAEAQKAREEKVREVSSTYEQLVAKMKGEIDKGQVTISELKGKLTVNMVDAILFDSGKSEIKPEGLVVLGKVIEI